MHRLASIRPRSSNLGLHILSSCFVVFALASSPPSLAQTKETSEVATTTPKSIVQFGDKFQIAQRAPLQQTRIFVYRQTNPAYPSPVNIYLEGRFHTALLNGGYSEFCAAPGRIAIQSVYDDAQKMHLGKEVPGQPWELKAGNTLYLRVNETSAMNRPKRNWPAPPHKPTFCLVHPPPRSVTRQPPLPWSLPQWLRSLQQRPSASPQCLARMPCRPTHCLNLARSN